MKKPKPVPGMLLGFKARFADYVREGSKTHTIRAKRKQRPKPGGVAHCYTGLRQGGGACQLLGRFPITRVQTIKVGFEPHGIAYRLYIELDGVRFTYKEADLFAWADGFRDTLSGLDSLTQMTHWYLADKRLEDRIDSPPWEGDVIHWDYHRKLVEEPRK